MKLHGPGAGSEPWNRRFFDLNHYRVIILFDQRGVEQGYVHIWIFGGVQRFYLNW